MPRPRPFLAAIASLAFAVACSPPSGPEPAASAPAAATTTLRIGLSAELGALDPNAFTGNFLMLDAIYEPLVTYGQDGKLEPGLAESWTVEEGGEQVTFNLRDGVKFTDGTPFDAAAVKWNFDRWVGNERFSFFRASQVIEKVEAPDPDTVRLTLSEPYEPLLQEMSIVRPVRLLSPKSAAADGKFQNPVGTGAWKLVSNAATGATLERNDEYWGTKPQLTKLEFKVIPDSQARIDALTNGELDLLGGSYLSPITPVEAQSLNGRDDVNLLTGAPDVSTMLGFNSDGPAGDKAVREAVIKAIDTASLAKALLAGQAEPAKRVFPPGVPDSGTDLPLGFDAAGAASTLEAAGYKLDGETRAKDGKPLSLRLLIPSTPAEGQLDPRAMASAIASELQKIGVGVEITPVDAAVYYDERAEGKYDITFFETLGAPYDPSSSIVSLFTDEARAPLWTTPAIEGLVDKALFAPDPAARGLAYQALYDAVAADAGFVPLVYRPRLWAVRGEVRGFDVPTTDVDLELTGVTIG
ncbi:ABC transporter substrate-binding protein [Acrocarpospora pleiomorpha]|uniref:ABC transporter substrate-binding protein n=1 Tax=Acrocarpospora pleiomorpha TaxID=90975 RepID=UPI0012D30BFA|nr:ABC transporter substrate-binding protein [Acrocarpospora pleiomorpha]